MSDHTDLRSRLLSLLEELRAETISSQPPGQGPRRDGPLIAVNLVLWVADDQAEAATREAATNELRIERPPAIEEIVAALKETRGNRSLAAKRLGISRTTLYRRLAAHEE